MGLVKETIKNKDFAAEIMVIQQEKGEYVEPYEIISFDTDNMKSYTPDELIKLGEWLISHGRRIKNEYTSSGKPKDVKKSVVKTKKKIITAESFGKMCDIITSIE